jgi:uncharacterized protein YcbX/ferredoxin
VQTNVIAGGLALSAPNMPTISLSYEKFSVQYQSVTVWGDEISGQLCAEEANAWFSHYLARPCQLLFFGQNSYRERKTNTDRARKLAFADGYPLLLISQASLDTLNQRLTSNQQQSVSMAQFRPNIVVDNCLPFAEDEWQHIRIGEVEFKVSKPCERCIFTTINPQNGNKHPELQPLRTLKSFRKTNAGEVLFGQNLIALNSGQIKEGDKLTIISKQKAPIFTLSDENQQHQDQHALTTEQFDNVASESKVKSALHADEIVPKTINKKLTVHFEKWNKDHQSLNLNSNQKTLLENGEDAGLILPYSCRAGMCGRCKAKLISGEVKQLSSDGLTAQEKQEGYILCCSSVAMSDVVIKHK